jgi:hypothetical protein
MVWFTVQITIEPGLDPWSGPKFDTWSDGSVLGSANFALNQTLTSLPGIFVLFTNKFGLAPRVNE